MTRRMSFVAPALVALCALLAPRSGLSISCPQPGLELDICVHNPSDIVTVPDILASGIAIQDQFTCTSMQGWYDLSTGPIAPLATECVRIPGGLVTGMWLHAIYVPASGQTQYQKAPGMLAVQGVVPRIDWTAFPNVVTVNVAGDGSGTTCPPDCTLRQAIDRATAISGGVTAPVLIQLGVSPGDMQTSQGMNLVLGGAGHITIDGTDENGNPWIVGDANAAAMGSQDPFTRVVDLRGRNSFLFASDNNTIKGLWIKNTLVPGTTQARNLVGVDGLSNRVEAVRIEGGNEVDCFPSVGNCGLARDLFNVRSGTDLNVSPGLTVANVEGTFALDKGLKANNGGMAVVRDSWFHNNYRGGIQATRTNTSGPGGQLLAQRNIVEQAGFRDIGGVLNEVNNGANGLAVQVQSSLAVSDENVIRNNRLRGMFARGPVSLAASSDYVCGNSVNGLATVAATQGDPFVDGTGIGAVYNGEPGGDGGHGIALTAFQPGSSFGDFFLGGGDNPGQNAVASNAECDFQNTTGMAINAFGNQWADPEEDICEGSLVNRIPELGLDPDDSDIILEDTDPVFPTNVVIRGQTIRVRSSNGGFNAIKGNPEAGAAGCITGVGLSGGVANVAGSCCLQAERSNTCSGVHQAAAGNCVELVDGLGNVVPTRVTAVTPALIVAEVPETATPTVNGVFSCLGGQGEEVWVTKNDSQGNPIRKMAPYCTNM